MLQDMLNHILQDITSNHKPLNVKKQVETEVNGYNKSYYR
jgi:hypothetical protein